MTDDLPAIPNDDYDPLNAEPNPTIEEIAASICQALHFDASAELIRRDVRGYVEVSKAIPDDELLHVAREALNDGLPLLPRL